MFLHSFTRQGIANNVVFLSYFLLKKTQALIGYLILSLSQIINIVNQTTLELELKTGSHAHTHTKMHLTVSKVIIEQTSNVYNIYSGFFILF